MEWAWKPMAALINERESDLVYWVPPSYTSNLLPSFSTSASIDSLSSSTSQSSMRRRKLAQRRPKLSLKQEIEEVSQKKITPNNKKRQHNINDTSENTKVAESINKPDDLENSLKKLDQPKNRVSHTPDVPKTIPPLFKVIERLAHIYTLPIVPHPPMYESVRPYRSKVLRNSTTRKVRRPSLKIYNVPAHPNSFRKKSINHSQEPFYVITKSKAPINNLQRRLSSIRTKSSSSNHTHISLPTMTEPELQNAHLDMILNILTSLYEEKIIDQNKKISQLMSKLQIQEKIIRQTAHLALGLKEDVKMIQTKIKVNDERKKLNKINSTDSDTSIPYHSLDPLSEEEESHFSQIRTDFNDIKEYSSECPSENNDWERDTESIDSNNIQTEKEKQTDVFIDLEENEVFTF